MVDPFSTAGSIILSTSIRRFFELLWQSGGDTIEGFRTKKEAAKKFQAAKEKYDQRYHARHGRIKIMPGLMKDSVSLEDVYTAVKLLDDHGKRYFRSEEECEKAYRQRDINVDAERLDGMDVANQNQFLMVLGGPGIGKSTFLKKLGAKALQQDKQFSKDVTPVLIELKELKDSDINLVQVLSKEFETCGFPVAEKFVDWALEEGELLILFDGLDEVPKQNFNTVVKCIEDFVDLYDQNHFVVSCRIAAYNSSFRRFTDVTIAEFDDDQLKQFIRRWFNSELDHQQETADKYWKLLAKDEHKATRELARTPLLLTFLCLIYDRKETFPKNRSALYGDALDILLNDWAAQKRIERDPIYEGFHPDMEKELLTQIAYDTFNVDQLFFPKHDITNKIAAFLADTLNAPKHLDGAAVLKAIEVQQGILVRRATNTYSFSHLTIQEYLAAQHIIHNWAIVEQYAAKSRWREVFLLAAGTVQGDSRKRLWLSLEHVAFRCIKDVPKIRNLVRWANIITDTKYKGVHTRAAVLSIASAIDSAIARAIARNMTSDSDRARAMNSGSDNDSDSAKAIASTIARAIASSIDSDIDSNSDSTTDSAINSVINSAINSDRAIDIAFARAIDIAFAHDSAIDSAIARASDITRSINNAINSLKYLIAQHVFVTRNLKVLPQQLLQLQKTIPSNASPSKEWQLWVGELTRIWLNGFDLTKEAVTLSSKEANALRDYLYITELLIRCKQSARRVSKKEWDEIEVRLLTLGDFENVWERIAALSMSWWHI